MHLIFNVNFSAIYILFKTSVIRLPHSRIVDNNTIYNLFYWCFIQPTLCQRCSVTDVFIVGRLRVSSGGCDVIIAATCSSTERVIASMTR